LALKRKKGKPARQQREPVLGTSSPGENDWTAELRREGGKMLNRGGGGPTVPSKKVTALGLGSPAGDCGQVGNLMSGT